MIEVKALTYVIPMLLMFSNTGTYNYFQHNNGDRRFCVTLNTYGQFGSNAFTTDFTYSFFTGQYLDDPTKDAVRNKLGEYNRLGADWTTEISFMNLNDSLLGKNWGYYMGIKNRMYLDSRFNSNFFNLMFYGNRDYAGQTADFSNTYADYVMYQQFQLGFTRQIYHNEDVHTLGFGISFLNGNMRYTGDIYQGSLYTDSLGEQVNLNAMAQLQRTAGDRSGFMANNGSGLSFDFFYEGKLGKNSIVSLSLNDIGFINWDRPGDRLTIDSSLYFSGIEVNNVFTTNGSEFTNFIDSLDQNYLKVSHPDYGLMALPMNLNLSYTHSFKEGRILFQSGIQLRAMQSFAPLIYAKGIFYPHKNVMLGTMVGYGGYSMLNVGLDLGFDFGKGCVLQLTTRNLEGVVPNRFGTAMSAGLKFSAMF